MTRRADGNPDAEAIAGENREKEAKQSQFSWDETAFLTRSAGFWGSIW
jgi:hypothetical protein